MIDPRDLAVAMKSNCTTETIADVLNALLSCEADESLNNDQADAGEQLFSQLCELCPDAVTYAQTGRLPCSNVLSKYIKE